jgi:hypothetical protein
VVGSQNVIHLPFQSSKRNSGDKIFPSTCIRENGHETTSPTKNISSCHPKIPFPNFQFIIFIRFCLQNNGRLSARKRASHFDFLSDEEIARMEQAVLAAYAIPADQ